MLDNETLTWVCYGLMFLVVVLLLWVRAMSRYIRSHEYKIALAGDILSDLNDGYYRIHDSVKQQREEIDHLLKLKSAKLVDSRGD